MALSHLQVSRLPSSVMDTVELTLSVPSLEHDRLIAWLDDSATGFVQNEAELIAYIPVEEWSDTIREHLKAHLQADGYDDALTVRLLADQNWNETWEQSISPVRVGPFLLCGTSTPLPPEHADATVLRIDPKMSFGTGHHATTRLALELLAEAVTPEDAILDVGTGTGVLAIAACKVGARTALGVDTSSKAITNARENVAQNSVADCVQLKHGSMDVVPNTTFDVIAANITRDILLDLLPSFHARLAANGRLLLSGLLISDRTRMLEALAANHFTVEKEATENGWWAACCSPQS